MGEVVYKQLTACIYKPCDMLEEELAMSKQFFIPIYRRVLGRLVQIIKASNFLNCLKTVMCLRKNEIKANMSGTAIAFVI